LPPRFVKGGCLGTIAARLPGCRRSELTDALVLATTSPSSIQRRNHPFSNRRRSQITERKSAANEDEISRDRLAELLNEDLSREYQAIIAYVVYSQVLSGAQYMGIAAQLEIHAKQELDHALILSRQIDYLGKMPVVTPKAVRTSKNPEEMLRYDLDNENETIRNYRDRVRQCESLGEYAMAEQIRQILVQEQDHQIDLTTALGIEVPDVGGGPKGRGIS
jgi:bacterioferritin